MNFGLKAKPPISRRKRRMSFRGYKAGANSRKKPGNRPGSSRKTDSTKLFSRAVV
jgi:hypothetical protein